MKENAIQETGMRISVLEDDPLMREMMVEWLSQAGYVVHEFATSRDFMRILARESFDLCLLDGNLPDVQGQEVLQWMRQDRRDTVPVMFVTARDAEEDVVIALQAGADDYVVKPVRRAELLARIEAILRRTRPTLTGEEYVEGVYRFDMKMKSVSVDGLSVDLTDKEFDLALFLFRNLGRLVSRGHLLEAVWGRNPTVATRTVDTHVSRVRTKLQLRPEMGYRLTPTYNYGYRLEKMDGAIV